MEKIFMLTVDGTSSGEYEHSAYSVLFKTKEEADDFVDSDFITQVVNAGIVPDGGDADDMAKAIEDNCIWVDEWNASFKFGDARTDYHIEIVKIPS
jgi:hypothetical protein